MTGTDDSGGSPGGQAWAGWPGPAPAVLQRPMGLSERLGQRIWRRPEPRLTVALAGAGVVMILLGILVWAGEQAAGTGTGRDDGSNALGIILSLVVIGAGYTLLLTFRTGPLATAGTAMSVLGVPVLLGFATFDRTPELQEMGPAAGSTTGGFDDEFGGGFGFEPVPLPELPFNVDAIVLVSLAAWLLSYFFVPQARGRNFYLGLTLTFTWLYLLELVEEGAIVWLASLPTSVGFLGLYETPDPTPIGWMSLAIAAGYYGLGWFLDHRGYRGVATPLQLVGFFAAVVGLGHLAPELELAGTGMVLILVGAALTLYGSRYGRRFTTWAWAGGVGLGILLMLADVFEDSIAGFGVAACVLGAAVIVVAHLLKGGLSEPDELGDGPPPGPTLFFPPATGPVGPTTGGVPMVPVMPTAPPPPSAPTMPVPPPVTASPPAAPAPSQAVPPEAVPAEADPSSGGSSASEPPEGGSSASEPPEGEPSAGEAPDSPPSSALTPGQALSGGFDGRSDGAGWGDAVDTSLPTCERTPP